MPLSASTRSHRVIASPIRKFVPLITATEASGVRIIKLHIGDPDLDAPTPILRAIRGYKAKTIPYAPSVGLPALIAGWQTYYKKLGVDLALANIVCTSGCAEAIQFAMLAVADPGDDIVCFEPIYTGFKANAIISGVNLVPVSLDVTDNFAIPSLAAIERRVTPRTKAIIVINPDNPTGKAWTKNELEAVLIVAKKRDLFVIMDETYREILFTGTPSTTLAMKTCRDRIVVIDSLSKRFSIPGARVGAVVSFNADIMDGVKKFAMARLSSSTVEQLAVIPMLHNPGGYVRAAVAKYKARRDAAVAALKKIPGVICGKPDGAFYVVARLPIKDSEAFVRYLLSDFRKNGETVSVTPLRDFYATPGRGLDEIRIALVRPPKDIARGIALLADALASYRE